MRFKIGQEIVCVHAPWQKGLFCGPGSGPKEGDVVRVKAYYNYRLIIYEWETCRSCKGALAFNEQCFEPLADITELNEILNSVVEYGTI